MRRMILFPILAVLTTCTAEAATLRPMTQLTGPVVFLRDLFDDAGPNADRPLGPGPGPGGRIMVGAAQLHAIARQFEVDWRPISTGDRAVLEWPGRPLPREDVLAALRAALIASGVAADSVIELAGFTAPTVPLGAEARPVVAHMDFNATTGRFTALLSVAAEGMDPISTRIAGQIEESVEVVVPTARLAAGSVLRPQDLRIARVPATQARNDSAQSLRDTVGLQLRRAVGPGQTIPLADLMRPALVPRESVVRMQLEAGGLSVTGQGLALEAGAAGERIRVRNMASQAVIEAEVIAPGLVRVAPGSMPLGAGPRALARLP